MGEELKARLDQPDSAIDYLDFLVEEVNGAFTVLSKECPHNSGCMDCNHPELYFDSMLCCPSNCPLL